MVPDTCKLPDLAWGLCGWLHAKATEALAAVGSVGRGTGQSNKLLVSQDEFNSVKNLIPLIWFEALQQASNFNSPAGQGFV